MLYSERRRHQWVQPNRTHLIHACMLYHTLSIHTQILKTNMKTESTQINIYYIDIHTKYHI